MPSTDDAKGSATATAGAILGVASFAGIAYFVESAYHVTGLFGARGPVKPMMRISGKLKL